MKVKLMRVGRGYFGGGLVEKICPSFTTSMFADNNFIVEYHKSDAEGGARMSLQEFEEIISRARYGIDENKKRSPDVESE